MEYFDEGRFWFRKEGSAFVLGASEEALSEVGHLKSVRMPNVDQECSEGDILCILRGADGELPLPTPVSGIVVALNPSVMEDLEIVHEDPIEEGWLVRIECQKE